MCHVTMYSSFLQHSELFPAFVYKIFKTSKEYDENFECRFVQNVFMLVFLLEIKMLLVDAFTS
jgi:hypothetical protein